MSFPKKYENIGTEKNFGITFSIFFILLGIYLFIINSSFYLISLFSSISFLIISYKKPIILKPLNIVWYKFGILLGKITNPIILFLIYFFVFCFIGFFYRFFNKKKFKDKNSTWLKRENDMQSLRNQF